MEVTASAIKENGEKEEAENMETDTLKQFSSTKLLDLQTELS